MFWAYFIFFPVDQSSSDQLLVEDEAVKGQSLFMHAKPDVHCSLSNATEGFCIPGFYKMLNYLLGDGVTNL